MTMFLKRFDHLTQGAITQLVAPLSRQLRLRIVAAWIFLNIPGLWRIYRRGNVIRFPLFGAFLEAYTIRSLRGFFYELFVQLEYWFPARSENPLIIDCGSNIGMSLLFFKFLYPQANILSFEPSPTAFALLAKNVQAYGWHNITLHQAAVGKSEGMVEFFMNPDNPVSDTSSTLKERKSLNTEVVSVRQLQLSNVIDQPVALLKLDIEGAENDVLDDLIASSKIALIDKMMIEYHHHLHATHDQLGQFLTKLEEAGFGYLIHSKRWAVHKKKPGHYQDIGIYAYHTRNKDEERKSA